MPSRDPRVFCPWPHRRVRAGIPSGRAFRRTDRASDGMLSSSTSSPRTPPPFQRLLERFSTRRQAQHLRRAGQLAGGHAARAVTGPGATAAGVPAIMNMIARSSCSSRGTLVVAGAIRRSSASTTESWSSFDCLRGLSDHHGRPRAFMPGVLCGLLIGRSPTLFLPPSRLRASPCGRRGRHVSARVLLLLAPDPWMRFSSPLGSCGRHGRNVSSRCSPSAHGMHVAIVSSPCSVGLTPSAPWGHAGRSS